MNGALSIYKKELQNYFYSLIAYVFLVLFIIIPNILFFFLGGIFKENNASMRMYFVMLPFVFSVFIPALTMGVWAKEKNIGTIELLLTLPLSQFQILLGKFFAALTVVAVALVFTLPIPLLTQLLLGDFDTGQLITQYFGALVMAGCFISICFVFSSLTEEVINSFLLSLSTLVILNLIGYLTTKVQFYPWLEWLKVSFNNISFLSHFANFSKGVIDSRDMFYYIGTIVIFFYLNLRSLESKRWS